MNTRSGDSCAMLQEVLAKVRRYFAKRRIPNVRVRAIEADALPIVTIAYRSALDRLDGTDYLGSTGGSDQFVLRLKGLSIRWDRPRPKPPSNTVGAGFSPRLTWDRPRPKPPSNTVGAGFSPRLTASAPDRGLRPLLQPPDRGLKPAPTTAWSRAEPPATTLAVSSIAMRIVP